MLKLIDQSLLSTKTGHNYWKCFRYSDVICRHIEWIIENIENSKDGHIRGHIRVRVNDFIKELGPNFAGRHYTSIFTELRYSLFKDGIIIDIGKHIDGDYQHEDFGRISAKGSKLFHDKNCYYWKFDTKKNKIPDFFFCIGYNESRTEVLCIYIIPNENILTNAIHINKNWSQHEDPYYWHKQDPKPWNDLFHTLKLEDCPVLKIRS